MNNILTQMLSKYQINNIEDKKNAIKEIVQEIVLCGLSRSDFFEKVAFYGGTALRIFYGLDRFSEDLDFSLITKDENFDLSEYFSYIKNETNALGLKFDVIQKIKSIDSNVKSAFLKGNTLEHILTFYENTNDSNSINKEELIKIKFEVDINPPLGATYESKYKLLPSPYKVKLYDLESLFAGKIHACLCRNWKTRVKGRDFYDYLFFISKGAKVNLENLKAKLVQSKFIEEDFTLTMDSLKELLKERFCNIDFNQAKEDVLPIIKDKSKLDLWSSEFFISVTESLK